MKHATDEDLKMIEGLLTGGDGAVTLRQQLAAALVACRACGHPGEVHVGFNCYACGRVGCWS